MNSKLKLKLHPDKLKEIEKKKIKVNDLLGDANHTASLTYSKETGTGRSSTLEALFVLDDNTHRSQKKSVKKSKESTYLDDHQIFNFLEREYNRLKHIDSFYSRKMELLAKYPQGEKLLAKQTDKCNLIKQQLISLLLSNESPLNTHLETLWNESFMP